ncbi:hypothetical protein DFH08DRAFT_876803 [Mycena albidolilacea]|uniref:Uncharacterized protein n=1 Tax=Mycena albidolilacea TaxID=1033008 RepID=A0AAD7EM67_9AGAR|nr:hypothetical protein DFH08DRAFT_876803 [Mycena albidolilacea]
MFNATAFSFILPSPVDARLTRHALAAGVHLLVLFCLAITPYRDDRFGPSCNNFWTFSLNVYGVRPQRRVFFCNRRIN